MRSMTPDVSYQALVEEVNRLNERVARIEAALFADQNGRDPAAADAGYPSGPAGPIPDVTANGPTPGALASIAIDLKRIADHVAPPPADIIGTADVAALLGCKPPNVGYLIRSGKIPKNCIVPGSGNGSYWRFYRAQIEKWRETRG
jgi:hypothetical protein